jgi:hypothetical protein
MPRFYFHIIQGGERIEDTEGSDLPNLAAARIEAIDSAREIAAHHARQGHYPDGQVFEISDDEGKIVLKMPFTEAL